MASHIAVVNNFKGKDQSQCASCVTFEPAFGVLERNTYAIQTTSNAKTTVLSGTNCHGRKLPE
jgi:hypothetical protein